MGGYIVHFIVYTLAMSGLICLALFAYKKIMMGNFSTKSGSKVLEIEETMNINPRKSLMIVKAGNERFLIASDVDKTTLISKLEQNSIPILKHISNNMLSSDVISDTDFDKVISNTFESALKANKSVDIVKPNKESKKVTIPYELEQKQNDKKRVHLEVIHDLNPKVSTRHGRKVSHTTKNRSKKVNIEVGKVSNHGLSTIKEMVAKVNEI